MPKQEQLINIINEISDAPENISRDMNTRIDELDLDSMNTMELLVKIEDTFNKEVSIEDFKICNTISDLLNLINKNG